ncbi:TetR/AcrR family transcriptional regulator [Sedimentibacter hydroxybenzoicus DSM 7310]|uniref:TetR/AcrR family transcriptional regulator n=1 Tax=Sedimentibacter hydroxybenzoicus DSM 7310 TaxID=1123245 RepID=A0A974GX40_SEDHY|nr:TetR/AcrR family transcriptional regulator [Sedimentibacter hydroxybenzoicus]NYB75172.1 TetR/AcrR family transcriptional regulator [Sedimentibacter hydroxybenzoicus DSM 7310]
MNGFEIRREKKMEDIIKAAGELFSIKGFKSVSIAEIAKKSNVSQVSIYNFFGNKENLAKQVLFNLMDSTMKELEVIVSHDISYRNKIEKLFAISLKSADSIDENLYRSEFIKDQAVQNFLEEYKKTKTEPLLMNLIEQGSNEGYLDSSISTESILLYIDSINSVLQTNISKKTRVDLGKLFYYGLLGEKNSLQIK